MEKVIKLRLNGTPKTVEISDSIKGDLKKIFSGCRVNFLFGAGFSANILGVLNNNETIFEAMRQFHAIDSTEEQKEKILKAYLYWSFFKQCIFPIVDKAVSVSAEFKPYKEFGNILYRIFSERSNPVLDRQFNIFTTNYDPIIELIFDDSSCICNDGFEGRINPKLSTDNFSKSYYRQAVFSNRKAEIPSVNLVKVHGSITWKWDTDGNIGYQSFYSEIKNFFNNNVLLFDDAICQTLKAQLTASTLDTAFTQISTILSGSIFDPLITDTIKYEDFFNNYNNNFLIVNPTKEKFSSTLLNKNYYELLRIFSNELEKENTLLVVNGFSFKDEHILDLTKRSMINPSLKILIFCYEEKSLIEYQSLLSDAKNNNITYIMLESEKLSLDRVNEILSIVHI